MTETGYPQAAKTVLLSGSGLTAAIQTIVPDSGGILFTDAQIGPLSLDLADFADLAGPVFLTPAPTANAWVPPDPAWGDSPPTLRVTTEAELDAAIEAQIETGGIIEIAFASGSGSLDLSLPAAAGAPILFMPAPPGLSSAGTGAEAFLAYAEAAPLPADTIIVSTATDLSAALDTLATQGGGTILLDGSAGPYAIDLQNQGNVDSPITLAPLSPDTPPVITSLNMDKCHGLTVTGMTFLSDGNGIRDITVQGSSEIAFTGNVMRGTADGFLREGGEATQGDTMMFVRKTTGFTFADNTVSHYMGGLGILESSDIDVYNNEFSHLQGDGIQGRDWDGVRITNNYLHDFFGSTQTLNHSDMIQIFGQYGTSGSRNVVISGNVLSSGNGAITQGIFIMNEDFGTGRVADGYFENITITDNVLYNGAPNGIFVKHVNGLNLSNNTVLWDPDAITEGSPGQIARSAVPWILAGDVENLTMEKNIAGSLALSHLNATELANVQDNVLITYKDRTSDTYAYSHFNNLLSNTEIDPRDLMLREDSDLTGYGAPIDLWIAREDLVPIIVPDISPYDSRTVSLHATIHYQGDAGRLTAEDLIIRWTFSDGTVLYGQTTEHTFTELGTQTVRLELHDDSGLLSHVERNLQIESPVLASLNFENGLTDGSGRDSTLSLKGPSSAQARALVEGRNGTGFDLGTGAKIEFSRANTHLYNLSGFEMGMDVQLNQANSYGDLSTMHLIHGLSVTSAGALKFWLQTDSGKFTLSSRNGLMSDTDWHRVSVRYDGLDQTLQLRLDGDVVAERAAWGTTAAPQPWGLMLGSNWGRNADAVIDNFEIGQPGSGTPDPVPEPVVPPAPAEDVFLFHFDFDDGTVADGSEYATPTQLRGDPDTAFVAHDGGMALHMDSTTRLEVAKTADQLSNLDAFTLNLSVAKDAADGTGGLVALHTIFDLDMRADGKLRFWLQTDEQKFYVATQTGVLSDTDWHDIQIVYSNAEESLSIYVDEALAGQTRASGQTAALSYWPLALGEVWGSSLEARVDDFWMTTPGDSDLPIG